MRTALLVICLLLTAGPALTAERSGVQVPDQLTVGDQTLVLNGLAMRSKFVFDVYVGALYLPETTRSAETALTTDQPRAMLMRFVREVGKDKLADAWMEGLEANTPGASNEVHEAFERLAAAMEDVEDGGEFLFAYEPGKGTTMRIKGTDKGSIEGKAFADALLACWIGPKPPAESFKKGVLGEE